MNFLNNLISKKLFVNPGKKDLLLLLVFNLIGFIFGSQQIQKIIDLKLNSTIDRSYFDYGSPLLTNTSHLLFFSNSTFVFIPQYTVLEPNLRDEGNIYVSLESTADILFQFYGPLHPDFPNYRVNISEPSIMKCMNRQSQCNNLNYCNIGTVVTNKENIDNKMINISWQLLDGIRKLQLQYKNQVLSCKDTNNILDIKKLVMYGSKLQTISTKKYAYSFTSTVESPLISNKFSVNSNSLLYFQILQCRSCGLEAKLICDNFSTSTSIFAENSTQIYFKDSSIGLTWTEIKLVGPENNSNCFLQFDKKLTKTGAEVYTYWAITKHIIICKNDTAEQEENIAVDKMAGLTLLQIAIIITIIVTITVAILHIYRRYKTHDNSYVNTVPQTDLLSNEDDAL